MIESGDIAIEEGGRKAFSIASLNDENNVAEARLLQVPWDGESAFALLTMPPSEDAATRASLDAARAQASELSAILDTATDGVIVLDRAARIVSAKPQRAGAVRLRRGRARGKNLRRICSRRKASAPPSTISSGCKGRAARR